MKNASIVEKKAIMLIIVATSLVALPKENQ